MNLKGANVVEEMTIPDMCFRKQYRLKQAADILQGKETHLATFTIGPLGGLKGLDGIENSNQGNATIDKVREFSGQAPPGNDPLNWMPTEWDPSQFPFCFKQ